MKKNYSEVNPQYEDVDLSARKKSKQKSSSASASMDIDYKKAEFLEFSKELYLKFSSNSSLSYNIKIPSFLVPAIKKYDGSEFEGLIVIIVEGLADLYYNRVADRFCDAVFDLGVDFLKLPEDLKVGSSSDLLYKTPCYTILDRAMKSYNDYLKFFYINSLSDYDKENSPRGHLGAVDIKQLLDSEKIKVSDLTAKLKTANTENYFLKKQISFMQIDFDALKTSRSQFIVDLETAISDYRNVITSLKSDIEASKQFNYYHFSIPRIYRILRFHIVVAITKFKNSKHDVKTVLRFCISFVKKLLHKLILQFHKLILKVRKHD